MRVSSIVAAGLLLTAAPRKRNQRGFALLETAFALSVLAILSVGLMATVTLSIKLASATRHRAIAREAAEALAAEIEAFPSFAVLQETFHNTDHPAGAGNDSLDAVVGDPDGLPTKVTVVPEAGTSGLLRIEVSVRWRGSTGDNRYDLVTFMADTGG